MANFKQLQQRTIEHEEIEDPADELEDIEEALERHSSELIHFASLEKDVKDNKPTAREKFFSMLTSKARAERSLAVKTEELDLEEAGDSVDSVKEVLKRDFPEYELINLVREEKGWTVELQENPAIVKTSYVNRQHGKVIGRTFSILGASFDVDQFVKDHEELAMRCVAVSQTFVYAPGGWFGDEDSLTTNYSYDEKLAVKIMSKEPDTMPIFQKYMRPGTVSIKLTPIRDAKPEELA